MKKLLYAVGGLVVLLIVVGLALPRHARVEGGVRIDAHPATVFALINDFRRMRLWSPLIKADPDGTLSIVASRPYEHVAIRINPGERGEVMSWFDLNSADGGTDVRWAAEIDYEFNLVGRYCSLLVKGSRRRDGEAGLLNLKELAESLPDADFSDLDIEALVVDAIEIAYLSTTSKPDPASIAATLGDAYFDILSFIDRHDLTAAGAPLAITHPFSGAKLRLDAAIPVRDVRAATPRSGPTVKLGHTYAGPVIRVKHIGSYRTLSATHLKIAAYLAALGIERDGPAWESYVSDPESVPEDELLTDVFYPIRE